MSKLFYLFGGDDYLLDEATGQLIQEWLAQWPEAELVKVDSDHMGVSELSANLEFNPLFALSRIVVLRDPPWLDKAGRQSKKYETYLQVLQAYLAFEPEQQIVLIRCREHFTSNPIAVWLKQQSQVMEVKPLSSAALEKWLKEGINSRGLSLPPLLIKKLMALEQDLYYLNNWLDRLALNKGDALDLKQAEADLDSRKESRIFKLTDALLNRQTKASVTAFEELLRQGEPVLRMLFMINQQFTQLARVKAYLELGWSRTDIEKELKMKEFVVRKLSGLSGTFSWLEIEHLFRRLLETDISMKSQSKDEKILMEMLLFEFCAKPARA